MISIRTTPEAGHLHVKAKSSSPLRICLVAIVASLLLLGLTLVYFHRGRSLLLGAYLSSGSRSHSIRLVNTSVVPTRKPRKQPNIIANNHHHDVFLADQRLLHGRKLPPLDHHHHHRSGGRPASDGRTATIKYNGEVQHTRSLPHFIIIGAKKSGTKSLITFLEAHAKIATAKKEAHFFDHKFHYGLEAYRQMMPLSTQDQLTVEKTPGYLLSKAAPQRIHGALPATVKFLAILKDPVTRAISDYTHYVARHYAKNRTSDGKVPSIESLIYKNGVQGEINEQQKIVRTGLYGEHLRQWFELFGRDRIHVVDGDRFIRAPWTELKHIQYFLNIPLELTKESFSFNKKKGFYCVLESDGDMDAAVSKSVTCLASNKGRKHLKVKESTLRDLTIYYRRHEPELKRLLGRNLSWMH